MYFGGERLETRLEVDMVLMESGGGGGGGGGAAGRGR